MLIFRPRDSRMAPSDADAMPLPSEETTPPVTNTNRVMKPPPIKGQPSRSPKNAGDRQPEPKGNNGNSTGIQVSRTRALRQSWRLNNNRGALRSEEHTSE